jgi:hypothetical protein
LSDGFSSVGGGAKICTGSLPEFGTLQQNFYRYRKEYGDIELDRTKRMKDFEPAVGFRFELIPRLTPSG